LEADEIKRLAPPYNIALAPAGRSVWFARADLSDPRPRLGPEHVAGPFVSPAPLEALAALRALLADGELRPASLPVRARAVAAESAYAPGGECFAAGLARFRREHGGDASTRGVLRLGARLWARRRAAVLVPGPDEGGGEASERPRRPRWDQERVAQALEDTILRAAHAARRARWLVRLSESSLAWSGRGRRAPAAGDQGGAVAARADLDPAPRAGPSRTRARPPSAARPSTSPPSTGSVFSPRSCESHGRATSVELRLGPHAQLSRCRLQAVLWWV
jgi:hypothetical protein